MKFFKNGFTLAEVLITLTIIGIVAAVTLPSLNANVSNRALEVQLSKFYNNLSKGLGTYMSNRGADTLEHANFEIDNFMQSSFKITMRCKTVTESGCFASEYYKFNGQKLGTHPVSNASYVYKLNDGTVVSMNGNSKGGIVTVDINGSKGPNKVGYDLWKMQVFNDGSVDDISMSKEARLSSGAKNTINSLNNNCRNGSKDYGCFAHFIRNSFKFDY